MKKSVTISAIALSAAAAAGGVYRFTFGRSRLSGVLGRKTRSPRFNRAREEAARKMARLPHTRLVISSRRGERLTGFLYPCPHRPTGDVAFLVHGLHSEHRQACGLIREYYHSRGYHVFCCDNTAAGESGGSRVGYGVYEREDCLRWLQVLRRRFGGQCRFVLHGFSMGGTVVLGLGEEPPEGVMCLVSDSAFLGAGPLLRPKLGPMYRPLTAFNRLMAGYSMADTDVTRQVKNSRLPTLFIHGRGDKVVPCAMGEELYRLHPGPRESLFLPDAGHVECVFAAKQTYEDKLDKFLGQYASGTAAP